MVWRFAALTKELATLVRPQLAAIGESVFLLVVDRAASLELYRYGVGFPSAPCGRLGLILIAAQMDCADDND
ncbi:MAG TPA: hypothetical protein VMT72_16585 [Pseudolabrys sp.]|nr:hypothetical protein [Pseudolabrys sp.]